MTKRTHTVGKSTKLSLAPGNYKYSPPLLLSFKTLSLRPIRPTRLLFLPPFPSNKSTNHATPPSGHLRRPLPLRPSPRLHRTRTRHGRRQRSRPRLHEPNVPYHQRTLSIRKGRDCSIGRQGDNAGVLVRLLVSPERYRGGVWVLKRVRVLQ